MKADNITMKISLSIAMSEATNTSKLLTKIMYLLSFNLSDSDGNDRAPMMPPNAISDIS